MILAQDVYISEEFKENQNIMVVGVPGSGKTRSLVIPHLMETDKSCMVLDPKGEIYNITHQYLEKKGFKVILLDFVNPKESPNRYNLEEHRIKDGITGVDRCINTKRSDGKEHFYIIRTLDQSGYWKDNAFIEKGADAVRVALFYRDWMGYEVRLWYEGRNVTFCLDDYNK